ACVSKRGNPTRRSRTATRSVITIRFLPVGGGEGLGRSMFNHEVEDSPAQHRIWRLLAVDDDADQRQLVATAFGKTPTIDVVPVGDGETALSTARHDPPDVVLVDLSIPGMGGLGLLQKLKLVVPRVPIGQITAHADGRAGVEAIRLGAYQFLTKPVNPQELLVIVKRAL